jgi:valyl-tRNA synthetase
MKAQNAIMYHFKVEVVEEPGTWLTIATTRPEVIPGDQAIAVNPKDERYAHLIGKHVRRPLPVEDQALLPIIADEHVDFTFGTGVLKVTPAHDKADFEIAQRHNLPAVDVMHPNGVLNELAGKDLAGMERFAARKRAAELLAEIGSLVKEEPYQNNLGYSERADVPIESRLSEQWFLKYPSVKESQAVVANGEMKFHPDRWAKVYDHWMTGLQDWCISRQVWWGHRIPVWRKTFSDIEDADDEEWMLKHADESVVCTRDGLSFTVSTAAWKMEQYFNGNGWEQDPDVLDTWFSSWLWPFATMGWPEKTSTLKAFYPTTDLVTGPDIIFFWVARMIMAGFEWMGGLPFKNVYFTGIIRDKQGRKMSKSLGNSPDPLELIASYSADALRFGIMRSAPLGQDICFDEKNVELGRNFCTKLWNAARFRQMQGGEVETEISAALLSSDDKWILLRLNTAIAEVSTALEEYRFSDATATLYRFFWSEYCDWYIEASKAVLQGTDDKRKANTLAVIDFVLGHTLRLFHPFMPFITEELWHGMGFNTDLPDNQGGKSILFAIWPKPLDEDELAHFGILPEDEKTANDKYEAVNLGRGLKSTFNINKRVRFVLKPTTELPEHEIEVLRILLNAEPLDVDAAYQPKKGTPAALTPLGELFLPLDGLIDVEAETARVGKEIAKVQSELEKVRAKLADTNFTSKVPQKVLDDHTQREADWSTQLAKLKTMLEALG